MHFRDIRCVFQGDDTVVTCVSLQSSIDYVVGVGTESAHVYIFQLPSIIPDGPKQVHNSTYWLSGL